MLLSDKRFTVNTMWGKAAVERRILMIYYVSSMELTIYM